MQRQVGINGAICQNVDLGQRIAMLEYVLSFLKELLLELVDEVFERISPQVFEVTNVA